MTPKIITALLVLGMPLASVGAANQHPLRAINPVDAPAKPGTLVASFDHELYAGPFDPDSLGSNLRLHRQQHPTSGYLVVDYDVRVGGYAGFWMRVGDAWTSPQDWSGMSAITFSIFPSVPLRIQIGLRTADDQELELDSPLLEPGRWQQVTLRFPPDLPRPGRVENIDWKILGAGAGSFALDHVFVK
jgi:hypothetical protein